MSEFSYPQAPNPEDTLQRYHRVISDNGIVIPEGRDLGEVLATFTPGTELIIRGYLGLYPFDSSQTRHEIAAHIDSDPYLVGNAYYNAQKQLRSGEYSDRLGVSGGISLEALGRALQTRPPGVNLNQLLFLAQLRGLSPFGKPLSVADAAEQHNISTNSVRGRAQHIARLIIDPEGTTAFEKKKERQDARAERLKHHLRLRDAGLYAGILSALAATETRDEWKRILSQDFANAAALRTAKRNQLAGRSDTPLSFLSPGKYTADYSRLAAKRGFNASLDTPAGREKLIRLLVDRASELTPVDIADLKTIEHEGKEAEHQIVEDNIALVFFSAAITLGRVGLANRRSETYAAGLQGLKEAARKYDGDVGFTFATYATKMIAGWIMNQMTADRAQKYNISVNAAEIIGSIQKAEQTIIAECGRVPENIDQLIAARLNKSVRRVRNYRKLWADAQTEKPSESVAITNHTSQDRELSNALREAFVEIFDTLHMSGTDAEIMFKLFGIDGEKFSEAELAEHLAIPEAVIKKRARQIRQTISQSPEAHKILMGFISRSA